MNEEKNLRLTVASSPHVASPIDTQNLMRDVLIALVPAMVMGVVFFGPRALVATIISVVACEFFEWAYRKIMKKSCANKDLSAAVTGVLLAFVCAPTLPYWMLIIGDFFAIVVVKQLFGGLGQNFLNPALAGRAFLMLCYPVAMTTWIVPGIGADKWANVLGNTTTMAGADIVTGATPLSTDLMHSGLLPTLENFQAGLLPESITSPTTLLDAFVGNVGGCIGEISALALLLGGVYLIARGVIRARIPVAYIATVAVLTFIFPKGDVDRLAWMLYQLFTGGLFLGAFFMATDYVTSPVTKKGERLRPADRVHPLLRRLPRGRELLHPDHELLRVAHRQGGQAQPLRRDQRDARRREGGQKSREGGLTMTETKKDPGTATLVVVLFLICLVTSLLLGLTNEVTAPFIEANNWKTTQEAMNAVLPADEYTDVTADYAGGDATVEAVYQAGDAGYVVQVSPPTSFSGNLTIMVGVDSSYACTGISVTSTGETSGLGSTVAVTKDGGDINAITGATITSRGVCEAVNSAIAVAESMG